MSSSDMGDDESVNSNLRFSTLAALAAFGAAVILVVAFWRLYSWFAVSARTPQDLLPVSDADAKAAAALRQRDIEALPVFVHGEGGVAAAAAAAADEEEGMVECAVCLAVMEDGERGRLLPGCGHRFHVDCIDQWFRANSTCPLCRTAAFFGEPSAAGVNKDGEVAQPVVVLQA